ncbi:MAG: stage III sporulation protein AF [Clostridia bacterium]
MIEFISTWVKGLGVAIVIVSIIEMILPNNKTKKYIKMVLGIYIIFNIISPLVKNKDKLNLENLNLNDYTVNTSTSVDQTSMNKRIETLYEDELEKDITKKLKEKGYELSECKVTAKIDENENNKDETKISNIKIKVEKKVAKQSEENSVENKIVTGIQQIKKVDIGKAKEKETKNSSKISKTELEDIKKFLIEEYEVNKKCLEIN